MTKKELIESTKPVAYYSGFNGLEIHDIIYDIEDYILCKSGAWGSRSGYRYHKLKIYYTRTGTAYINLDGVRVPLIDCIRM